MREVTERDFRKEEFKDAKAEDYEIREDGAIVRKDRWEMAVRKIYAIVDTKYDKEFEIDDIVEIVREKFKGE